MGSAKNVGELFDDFVASFSAGGDPDVLDYLTRAGARRDELATLLDAFLAAAAPPEPSEEKVAAMRAWIAGQPPLLDLRVRRGLKAEAVVERLRELLVLPARALGALRVAYHELEGFGGERLVDSAVLGGRAGLTMLEQVVQARQLHDGDVGVVRLF